MLERQAKWFARTLGPPLVAFLLVRVLLFIAAHDAGYPYFHYLSWHRFDSGFYVDSATKGYTYLRCVSPNHGWCGRAGWFPGYSILIGALSALGPTPRQAAITVSLLFCFGALVVLWVGLLDRSPTPRNLIALAFAAFVPSQIYDHTVFPLSVASFFVLLAFALLRRRRFVGAGLAGAAACMSYPTAVLIAPLTAVWMLYAERGSPWRLRLGRAALTSGLMALGLGAVLLIDKLEVGVWDAYFKVQAHYHHTARDPLVAWADIVRPLRHGIHGLASVPRLEAAFVAALVIVLLLHSAWRRRRVSDLELLALAFAVAVWLVPAVARRRRRLPQRRAADSGGAARAAAAARPRGARDGRRDRAQRADGRGVLRPRAGLGAGPAAAVRCSSLSAAARRR